MDVLNSAVVTEALVGSLLFLLLFTTTVVAFEFAVANVAEFVFLMAAIVLFTI